MEVTGSTSNFSNEQLMRSPSTERYDVKRITKAQWISVFVLCYVNLINYMDRYTLAGIMDDIKNEFKIKDDKAGLLQTVFVITYMIFAPVFGYFGDRYSRKLLMAFGVTLWGLTTLLGSFMDTYSSFISCRALVGIGEASYSTIAPTIISDLFVKDVRAKMLALFYFAIPVGSGLGYIVGSKMATLTGSWHWALRVTPALAALAVVLLLALVKDPQRGESEGGSNLKATSWGEDLRTLVKNRSFMFSTMGFMCVSFVTGALAWWGPLYIHRGVVLQHREVKLSDISFSFGWITMVAGIVGVPLGSFLSQKYRTKNQRADPIICATGIFICAIFFTAALVTPRFNLLLCYFLVFFGQLAINLNWSITADILLYVVIPTRRSTAEAFQILISHALGDAGSPYFIGAIADLAANNLRETNPPWINGTNSEDKIMYFSLEFALFSTFFVEILGIAFFSATAVYIIKDKLNAEREVRGGSVTNPNYLFADETSDSQ